MHTLEIRPAASSHFWYIRLIRVSGGILMVQESRSVRVDGLLAKRTFLLSLEPLLQATLMERVTSLIVTRQAYSNHGVCLVFLGRHLIQVIQANCALLYAFISKFLGFGLLNLEEQALNVCIAYWIEYIVAIGASHTSDLSRMKLQYAVYLKNVWLQRLDESLH